MDVATLALTAPAEPTLHRPGAPAAGQPATAQPPRQPEPEPEPEAQVVRPPSLIHMDDIKSILYLGVRGELNIEPEDRGGFPHQVDTFA